MNRSQLYLATQHCKEAKRTFAMISPVPLYHISQVPLSSQASSAPAKRLFSDLGRADGTQPQPLHCSKLHMTKIMKAFVTVELSDVRRQQSILMLPTAHAFCQLVNIVADVFDNKLL